MKKILLPTDFSENAYNAIDYAINLFKNVECTFYLLNTYTPVLYDTEYILYSPSQISLDEIYKINSESGLTKIEKRIRADYNNPKHTIKKIASFNILTDEIKEQVADKNIDLVVMGTKGATGAAQILFGSNTVHVTKRAPCLLLAIPSQFKFKPVHNILFPTDFEIDYSILPFKFLDQLSDNYQSQLNILHVIFGTGMEQDQERGKKQLLEKIDHYAHKFYTVYNKSVPQAIYDFQNENETDLLLMINNHHSFFENLLFRPVINEIGFHVKTPFLIIPANEHKH